jgi:hypothetical protein
MIHVGYLTSLSIEEKELTEAMGPCNKKEEVAYDQEHHNLQPAWVIPYQVNTKNV